jgi:RNase P subunit RPR2
MIAKLLDAMFGCRHARYSFPITVRAGSRRTPRTGTYVACLDCGKEFRYDWHEMRIVGSRSREAAHSMVAKHATKEAA